jgi:hypothetical protein
VVNGNHLICPTEGKNGAKIDLLLLVDQSTDYFMSSMLPAILTELQWICNCTLTSSSIKHTPPNGWYAPDIRVAIVGFGGSPRLLLPFTV